MGGSWYLTGDRLVSGRCCPLTNHLPFLCPFYFACVLCAMSIACVCVCVCVCVQGVWVLLASSPQAARPNEIARMNYYKHRHNRQSMHTHTLDVMQTPCRVHILLEPNARHLVC